MEFGAAAAVARWTRQGKHVSYCMVTSGEAGIDSMDPGQSGPVREAEQVESARVVGVDTVDFRRLPDGILEYGVPLRRVIAAEVRRHRPEIVITNNFRESWGGALLNQADHIATGIATADAVRDAGNRWIFPEQLDHDTRSWHGVKELWAASSPRARHGVDITETFDLGVASLRSHRAYIEGLGWEHFDPAEFLQAISRQVGTRMGVTHATAFEVLTVA
jgi:LmbE family N-acetylglucosaminyl deacetylase